MKHQFKARLVRPDGIGTWTFLVVPERTMQKFPTTRSKIPVRGIIDKFPIRNTLLPRGDGKHFMVVKKEVRDSIMKQSGDFVDVTIERDTAPRIVKLPADLKDALGKAKVSHVFQKLSYSHQKEYVDWVEAAKKPLTRRSRIEKTAERVALGLARRS
jgi:hypothetical protein